MYPAPFDYNRADSVGEALNLLEGTAIPHPSLPDMGDRATDDLNPGRLLGDIQASREYRAQRLRVYTRRALERAGGRATTVAAAD